MNLFPAGLVLLKEGEKLDPVVVIRPVIYDFLLSFKFGVRE
jgi:hypothetical protein